MGKVLGRRTAFLAGFLAVASVSAEPAAAPLPAGKVLTFLKQISGTRTVGGVHNDQKTGGVSYYTDRLRTVTGKVPGLWGGDFAFDGRIENRWSMIYEAERQWNAGALVDIMWHACPPTVAEPCSWDGDIKSELSASQWSDLVTEGGRLNAEWKKRIDRIAPFLKYLDDKGIEVLWRPHHEMNQGNFWWGGRPGPNGTARLYQVTHDYMTQVKGLKHLVWTWDIQDLRFDWDGYHPGDAYFDVMALDVYSMGYTDSLYNSMLRLAGDKPIALGEVQKLPTPAQLAKYPRYTFVMAWAYMTFEDNSNQALTDFFTASTVLTRDEMPGWNNVTVAARQGTPESPGGMTISLGSGTLSILLPEASAAVVSLHALDGRLLRRMESRSGRLDLPVQSLPSGLHAVTVTQGGVTIRRGVAL